MGPFSPTLCTLEGLSYQKAKKKKEKKLPTHPKCKKVIKKAWKANRLMGWVGSGEIGYIWVKN